MIMLCFKQCIDGCILDRCILDGCLLTDFEQVKKITNYFSEFEQFKKIVVTSLTLNMSKNFPSKLNNLSQSARLRGRTDKT